MCAIPRQAARGHEAGRGGKKRVIMNADMPTQTAVCDFSPIADLHLPDNWHLPPGGDQSWREQDALRIFSLHGKSKINDTKSSPAAEDEGRSDDEGCPRYQPGFRPNRTPIVLPLAMATCLSLFIVALLMPEDLKSAFWEAPGHHAAAEAGLASAGPGDAVPGKFIRAASLPPPERLRPSLAR